MLDAELFLGFAITVDYQQKLDQLPLHLLNTFIHSSSNDYLKLVAHENITYIGKFLGLSIKIDNFLAVEEHIYSLLKKLIPQVNYQKNSLVLMALPIS